MKGESKPSRFNPVALTVAGSDSGGGAGIQADLKTFFACGVYGASVITALTAQNLSRVALVEPGSVNIVKTQMETIFEGYQVAAVKTGMLFYRDIVQTVAAAMPTSIPLVVDPVFAATSGALLIEENAVKAMMDELFPLAALITPNVQEAAWLSGLQIREQADQVLAAEKLLERHGVAVLVKGGDLGAGSACDVLAMPGKTRIFESELLSGVNTHGSGCTLAAAIAAGLALGLALEVAVEGGKDFVFRSLQDPLVLAPGIAVLNHRHQPRY